jgi:hypothetical protein
LTWAHFESSQPAASGEYPNPICFLSPSWLGFEGICDLYEWGCGVMGWQREDDTNYGGWIEDKLPRSSGLACSTWLRTAFTSRTSRYSASLTPRRCGTSNLEVR